MAQLFKEFNEAKWEQVRTHPYYAPAVAAIRAKTEEMLRTDPPRILFSQIHLYVTTGDRKIFERVYSAYQDRLVNYFFMYCLDGEQKYIDALADILWNICDFESWSIPAHVSEALTPELRRANLDLTSTILGFRIAEILHFIGDKLPALVYKRAMYEVRSRVIDSYKIHDYPWMRNPNNWSAVCIAAVLAAYLYIGTKEEIDEQLPRMIETMRCYISGFDEEGCCLEGYGYWNYGFSHFCLFSSLLREYTDGKIDLFDDPKIHAVARFQQNITINSHQCISFSDCGQEFTPYDWLSHFLKHEYPDLSLPGFAHATADIGVLRYILWADPDLADAKLAPESMMYEKNQWYAYRSPAYNLACKAGYNEEPHNHNDVGSFIFSKDDSVSFTDPGTGEYTRQYFSAERYSILEPSSRSHSVPIINGQLQTTGKEKSTVFCAEEGHYAFSMENAYDIPTLTSLRRAFICEPDGVRLTDTYDFTETPESIVERFASLEKPEITPEGVRCGSAILTFDSTALDVQITSENRIRGGKEADPVYFTDLRVRTPEKHIEITVYLH